MLQPLLKLNRFEWKRNKLQDKTQKILKLHKSLDINAR